MKRSRFTEEQIAYALRLADSGTPVVDVCRQLGVSEATFYTWKKKYADFGVSELRKLKQLEDENARLRRIVADLTLDKQIRWCEKKSEGRQTARAGGLDTRALPDQRAARLRTRVAATVDLVRQESCARPKRAAPAHSRHRPESSEIRLPACIGDAATRGLERRQETCLSSL